MRLWVGLLSVFFCSAAVAASPGGQGWRHVRTVGLTDMVLIDRTHERNKDVYRLAVGGICGRKPDFCKVLFWTDEKLVPAVMPMSDASARALKADWTFNGKTGARSMRWACTIDADPTQCFR